MYVCTIEWHCLPPVFEINVYSSIFKTSILLFTVHACSAIPKPRNTQIKINWWCSSFCKNDSCPMDQGHWDKHTNYWVFALQVLFSLSNLIQGKLLLAIMSSTRLKTKFWLDLLHVLYPLSVNQSTICFLSYRGSLVQDYFKVVWRNFSSLFLELSIVNVIHIQKLLCVSIMYISVSLMLTFNA